VVPLDVTITHFGASDPGPTKRLTIDSVRIGTQTATEAAQNVASAAQIREQFAPGQFFDLTEDQKLAGPEFESLPAGLSGIGSGQITWGAVTSVTFDYETIVVDAIQPAPARTGTAYQPRDQVIKVLANCASAALAKSRTEGANGFRGASLGIEVHEPAYRIATKNELAKVPGTGEYASRTEAATALVGIAREGSLQVVGAHEEAA
jgi:hypothetical protein